MAQVQQFLSYFPEREIGICVQTLPLFAFRMIPRISNFGWNVLLSNESLLISKVHLNELEL
jgi:hypothetical protein